MQGWRILLWVILVVFAVAFLWMVRGVLLPFVVALILSALLEPSVRKLRVRGWPKGLAVGSVVSLLLGFLVLLGIWLTPVMASQLNGLRSKAEELTTTVSRMDSNSNFFARWNPVIQVQESANDPIDRALDQYRGTLERFNLPTNKRAFFTQYVEPQKTQINKSIQSFLSGFLGLASGLLSKMLILIFVPLLLWMMLLNMDRLRQRTIAMIPPALRASTVSILTDIGQVFTSYLRGVTIAVLGYMVTMSIALSILGAPYAVLLGILFGAIYLIPYLNGVLCSTILLTITGLSGKTEDLFIHTGSPWAFGGILVVCFFVVHFTYDSLVYPRVVGGAVGLDPIISMFVIFSGGALFGLAGMIIAFPLAGSVKVVLDRLIRVTSATPDQVRLPATPLRHRGSQSTG